MNNAEPTVQECENFLSYRNDKFKCIDIAGSVNASELVLRKMAEADFNGYEYLIRIAILENPNCPEDLALSLMRNATDVKERDRAYGYWQRKHAIPNRGDKFKVAAKPEFPSELIGSSSNDIEEVAKGFLAVMPAIAEYLWFELASAKLVQLAYWADDFYGDTFGLIGLHSEFDSQLYRVLGRGYFTDWIERDGIISQTIGFDRLANEAEEFISEKDWADETCDGEPYPTSLLGYVGAYGDLMNHLTLNRDHPMWLEIVEEMFMDDPTSWDYEVTITSKPDWNGQTWAELSGTEQVNFVTNIEKLLPHPYLGEWGFVRHFLSLFEIHPGTKAETLALISNLLGTTSKIKKGPDTQDSSHNNHGTVDNLIKVALNLIEGHGTEQAEAVLVDAHEKSRSASQRDRATLLIIEEILIPNMRLAEARMWVRSVVNTEKREQVQSRINKLDTQNYLIKTAIESNEWQQVNLDEPMQPSTNQQYFYNRFLKYLTMLTGEEFSRETISTWPGPSFYGYMVGAWDNNPVISQLGCERETIAKAGYDFFNYVMTDPLGSEDKDPALLESPYRDYSEPELLELCVKNDPWALKQYGVILDRRGERDKAVEYWGRAAAQGNHAAIRNLAVTAVLAGDMNDGLSLIKQAIAAGSRTSHHVLAEIYESTNPNLVESTLREGVEILDVQAMNRLGVLMGQRLDRNQALKYYRMAAEFGEKAAMANLANLLFSSDREQSIIWLERSEDQPPNVIQPIINNLRVKLSNREEADDTSTMDVYELIEYYCENLRLDLVSEIMLREFGNYYFEDDIKKLSSIDPNRVWTELMVSNGNLFITNHFDPDDSKDPWGWFVFEKPCQVGARTITVPTVSWKDCKCLEVSQAEFEDSEDAVEDPEPDPNCDSCNGNGSVKNYTFK